MIKFESTTITLEQARVLAAWLGNVRSIVQRRGYRGNPAGAHTWVSRWFPILVEYYAHGATPEEAVSAVPTAIKFPA